jgi:hypothetical protein
MRESLGTGCIADWLFLAALTRENGTGGLGRKRDSYGVLASRTDP